MPVSSSSLQVLKERLEQERNLSPRSQSSNPTPLKYLLELYLKSRRFCYVEYMEGFKLLHSWLSPISYDPIPQIKVPEIFGSYELNQLTYITGIPYHVVFLTILEISYGPQVKAAILLKSTQSPQVSS